VPLGWCVVAEAGCNWYLLILIYSLYLKKDASEFRKISNIVLWTEGIVLAIVN
jgi:hypothetical protein